MNLAETKTRKIYDSIPEDFRKQIPDVFAIVFEYKKDLPASEKNR